MKPTAKRSRAAKVLSSPAQTPFAALAEVIRDIIIQADPTGRLVYVSPACRSLGWAPEELIGRQGLELVHPDDRPRFLSNTTGALAGGVEDPLTDREIRYQRKDGGWAWLEGSPHVLRDADGRATAIVNVFRDVTAKRRLREEAAERARFEGLAKSVAGVGYWWMDVATGRITWSEQMFHAFGLPVGDEPPLAAAMAAVHPDDQAASDERLRRAVEEGINWSTGETRLIWPDGEVRYVDGRAVCQRDAEGRVVGVLGAMVDITALRRAELAQRAADAERDAKVLLFDKGFNTGPIAKALVGLNGELLRVNAAFCDLVGYPEAELLALDFQTITHPDDLDLDLDFLAQLTAGDIPHYEMDKRYIRADGEVVWAHLSVSMVSEDGQPRYYVSQMQDLTAARRAAHDLTLSEQRYRRMAENSPDIITESNLAGELTYVSPAALTVAGYTPEELLGRRTHEFMPPEGAAAVDAMCRAVLSSNGTIAPWPIEYQTQHKDGRPLWLECRPIPQLDPDTGRLIGFNDSTRDITSHKQLEAELRQARTEADDAAAVKGQFLANMSHEIRTPLTAILGFTGLMAERGGLDDANAQHLRRVQAASRSLLALVNDILDFSKLEAGAFDVAPRPVPLVETVHDVLLMFEPQAAAKGLVLELACAEDLPETVSLDSGRLQQVLVNLIGNAVKFTAEGRVTVHLGYKIHAARLHLAVEDTGTGLNQADQDKLFRRFSQVDSSSTRQHGGTGLGLAICKGLVEAMGGRISVESVLGQGSTFTFSIEAPVARALVEACPAAPAWSLDGLRILVVDDNPTNRELARALLGSAGAEVTLAADGPEALVLAGQSAFDAMLIDRRMPGMDGMEVLARLRAEPGPNDGVPMLAFTADADREAMTGPGGFDDVILKPIDPAGLIDAIARWTQAPLSGETPARVAV